MPELTLDLYCSLSLSVLTSKDPSACCVIYLRLTVIINGFLCSFICNIAGFRDYFLCSRAIWNICHYCFISITVKVTVKRHGIAFSAFFMVLCHMKLLSLLWHWPCLCCACFHVLLQVTHPNAGDQNRPKPPMTKNIHLLMENILPWNMWCNVTATNFF